MASTTRTVSFQTPQDSLRQATLKKNMSITQTYYLAHKARAKLSREAAQPDHDLRLLVGHANLLDTLMMDLADAEREQERWFNQSVASSTAQKQQDRHVQFAENIREVPEEEYDSDSSSDDDYDEDEDIVMTNALTKSPSTVKYLPRVDEEEINEDNLEEDYAQLELVRTPSHTNSPPELVDEYDSSDDESMPPSPPQPTLSMPEEKDDASKMEADQESMFNGGLYLTQQSNATAISVY